MNTKFATILTAIISVLLLDQPARTGKSDESQTLYTGSAIIESKFSKVGFMPDGDLSKPQWKKARWVWYQHKYTGEVKFPEAATEVASLWTKDHIYFAYRVHYTELNVYMGEDLSEERWLLWERDAVEVFLNPRPEHLSQYYEFEVAPNNMWLDLMVNLDKGKDAAHPQWDSGFEHATRVNEKARVWTCEFRIPLASMNVAAVSPGEVWRLNFFRMDGKDEAGSTRRMTAWSVVPPNGPVHTPARFGKIRFVK